MRLRALDKRWLLLLQAVQLGWYTHQVARLRGVL
jgi:hypothetical protein